MSLVLALLMCVNLTFPAFAEGTEGNLTLEYVISDCTFSLYRVADYDNGSYDLTNSFASLAVDWTQLDEESWYYLAETLEVMMVSKGIEADQSGQTDASYEVTFTGLQRGLYLILAETMTVDGYIYTMTPMLIVLTDGDGDGLADAQEITISKYTMTETSSSDEDNGDDADDADDGDDGDDADNGDDADDEDNEDLVVVVIWDDEDSEDRPTYVTVYLIKDGEIVDSVVLSEENGWTTTWYSVVSGYTWMVAESDLPEGYAISYSQDGNTFIIVNTARTTDTDDDDSDDSSDDSSSSSGTSGDSDSSSGSGTSGDSDTSSDSGSSTGSGVLTSLISSSSDLPQTGMNWLPVIFLVLAGMVCLIIGRVQSRCAD